MEKKIWLLVILITLLGFFIRIYKITSSPEGLYIDETSIGYNAYSIITTGRDEHGKFMPLFFEAFGEWKLPVYIYSVAIIQLFIGPTDLSVRLPAVLFGTLTIPLLFLWIREMLKDKFPDIRNSVALFGTVILALSQWHFQFTHIGFEASVSIMFLTSGLYFFFKAHNRKSLIFLLLFTFSFVFALYSYNSSKVVIPILSILLFILYFRSFRVYQWLPVIVLGLTLLFPLIKFSLSSYGMVRVMQVGLFYQPYIADPWQMLFRNYLLNISPVTLFLKGEPTIASNSVHRMSLISPVEILLITFGLSMLVKRYSRMTVFIPVFLFCGFLPAALTTGSPHALRSSLTIPAIVFISAFGMGNLLHLIKNKKIKWLTGTIIICFLTVSSMGNLNIYHNLYTRDSGWDWQVGIKRTAQFVKKIENNYDRIYFDDNAGAKVSFLWWLKYPPVNYQLSKDKIVLDKYRFVNIKNTSIPIFSLYINNGQSIPKKLVGTVYYPNLQISNKIWSF